MSSARRKIRLSPYLETEVAKVAEMTGETGQSVLSFAVFFGLREIIRGGLVDPCQTPTRGQIEHFAHNSGNNVLTPARPLPDPNQGSNPPAGAGARSSNPNPLRVGLNTLQKEDKEKKERKREKRNKEKPDPEKSTENDFELQVIFELWNQLCPSLPKVQAINDSRRQAYNGRKTEQVEFEAVFKRVELSDFLTGRADSPRKWQATWDWVMKPANMMKILEGNYDNERLAASPVKDLSDWERL